MPLVVRLSQLNTDTTAGMFKARADLTYSASSEYRQFTGEATTTSGCFCFSQRLMPESAGAIFSKVLKRRRLAGRASRRLTGRGRTTARRTITSSS